MKYFEIKDMLKDEGKSKPKQLLNGSYLINSGDDKLIEKERIKICGNCKKPRN